MKKEQLEKAFEAYLLELQPKAEYLRLLGEVILSVWKDKQRQLGSLHDAACKHLALLRQKKQKLVDALVYERTIDQATYDEQIAKVKEELTLAELAERDARIEQLDVEGAMSFARHVLGNAARLWVELPFEQKQRLQRVLFPEGLQFSDGVYKTARTNLVFSQLGRKIMKKESLVALTGIEPVF